MAENSIGTLVKAIHKLKKDAYSQKLDNMALKIK